jgi:hypothetical protein
MIEKDFVVFQLFIVYVSMIEKEMVIACPMLSNSSFAIPTKSTNLLEKLSCGLMKDQVMKFFLFLRRLFINLQMFLN